MSNDPTSGGGGDVDGIPGPVRDWLSGIAEERGLTERELLGQLLAGDGTGVRAGEDVAALAERVESLESGVEELEDRLDDQIQDVRDRVIQVKREADAKAPADHDHPELAERLRRVDGNVDALGQDVVGVDDAVTALDDRLDRVEERMSEGFANYEEVLEYLVDAADDVDRKLDRLAAAFVGLRERAERLASADANRAAVDRLRESAHEHGVTTAKCEDCRETVDLGLLTSPACPNCGMQLGDVEPGGFLRSSVLRSGSRPALEGEVADESPPLDDLLAEDREAAPSFDRDTDRAWSSAGAAEAAEGGGGGAAAESTADAEDSVPADEGETGDSPEPGGSSAGGRAGLEVDAIAGIGSAYSARLRKAGVETVGDLALAEPDRLARDTDIAANRVEKWVGRARRMVGSG